MDEPMLAGVTYIGQSSVVPKAHRSAVVLQSCSVNQSCGVIGIPSARNTRRIMVLSIATPRPERRSPHRQTQRLQVPALLWSHTTGCSPARECPGSDPGWETPSRRADAFMGERIRQAAAVH